MYKLIPGTSYTYADDPQSQTIVPKDALYVDVQGVVREKGTNRELRVLKRQASHWTGGVEKTPRKDRKPAKQIFIPEFQQR